MATHIQHRRDLAQNWADKNTILYAGELGVEIDTLMMKLGDGVTPFNDLPYVSGNFDPAGAAFAAEVAAKAYADDLVTGRDPSGAATAAEAEANAYATSLVAGLDPLGAADEAKAEAKAYTDQVVGNIPPAVLGILPGTAIVVNTNNPEYPRISAQLPGGLSVGEGFHSLVGGNNGASGATGDYGFSYGDGTRASGFAAVALGAGAVADRPYALTHSSSENGQETLYTVAGVTEEFGSAVLRPNGGALVSVPIKTTVSAKIFVTGAYDDGSDYRTAFFEFEVGAVNYAGTPRAVYGFNVGSAPLHADSGITGWSVFASLYGNGIEVDTSGAPPGTRWVARMHLTEVRFP